MPVAELMLTPGSSFSPTEFVGMLSTAKRRRLFRDLPSALEWARARAEVVGVRVDEVWWSAGTVPYEHPRARPLTAEDETVAAQAVADEFRRDAEERKRFSEAQSWYLAFWIDATTPIEAVGLALRAIPRVTDVAVRPTGRDRRALVVTLEAQSRDEVLRRGIEEVRQSLVGLQRKRLLPAGRWNEGVGHHEIGLLAYLHRNQGLRETET